MQIKTMADVKYSVNCCVLTRWRGFIGRKRSKSMVFLAVDDRRPKNVIHVAKSKEKIRNLNRKTLVESSEFLVKK